MIEEVNDKATVDAVVRRGILRDRRCQSDDRRTITEEEADTMRANPGKVYCIAGPLRSQHVASVSASRLRKRISSWYGGRWSVKGHDAKVYAAYLGD